MNCKVNPELFAQSVVSSSSETDVSALFNLYIEAMSVAQKYNELLPKEKGNLKSFK
ncbi:hypothetical protein [Lactococcus cremoris]|uniref:hypothetical protein n=1 Tax=Lactococcus lactis subsp. cremoris TaxID=1359 RepID=UPI00300E430A